MTNGNLHQIWVEQCVAAETIKLRYGLKAAFDYAVAEKLLNFAEAAAQHPEFARELPRFVSRVRQMFTAQELVVGICQTSCPLISCGVSDFRGAVFVFGVEPDWSSRLPVSGFA